VRRSAVGVLPVLAEIRGHCVSSGKGRWPSCCAVARDHPGRLFPNWWAWAVAYPGVTSVGYRVTRGGAPDLAGCGRMPLFDRSMPPRGLSWRYTSRLFRPGPAHPRFFPFRGQTQARYLCVTPAPWGCVGPHSLRRLRVGGVAARRRFQRRGGQVSGSTAKRGRMGAAGTVWLNRRGST
jgi:hypothetical protein